MKGRWPVQPQPAARRPACLRTQQSAGPGSLSPDFGSRYNTTQALHDSGRKGQVLRQCCEPTQCWQRTARRCAKRRATGRKPRTMLPPGLGGDAEKGMPMDNVRLYQVLNLSRTDATPEEIKRAYRKTAARVHPDRNRGDADATQRFQEVQYAYSVLSDPQLRGIYDSYGEQGLKMYESYMSFADSDGSAPYLPVGNPVTLITFLCIGLGLLVAIATALCVDLYLKLQGISTAPLSLLLIPLWILNALALGLLYVFLVAGARKGTSNLLHPAGRITQLLLLIA